MTAVSCEEAFWKDTPSGRRFGYRLWKPPKICALLVLLHGFGEHGGRYHQMATALAEQGMCVAAPDLWGHGRSGGARGDLVSIERNLQALTTLTREVFLPESGQAAYALFGHSFGGLAAIAWALQHPEYLRSVIAQSPLLEVGFPIPWPKRCLAWLAAVAWPTLSFSMNLDLAALSHDPAVIDAYRTDPLVHNAMSARSYQSIRATRRRVFAGSAKLNTRMLMLCGAADGIISLEEVRRWYEHVSCEKRMVVFPDSYHELHHEPIRSQVFTLVREWVLGEGV